ncbi:MAG: hypothetical protein ACXWXS_09455 [Actinomycetota bacterium]
MGPLLVVGLAAFVALDVLLVLRLTRSDPVASIDDLPAAVVDGEAASERDQNVGNTPELGATTITDKGEAGKNEGGAIDRPGDKPRATSESGSSDTGSGTSAPAGTSTSDPGGSNPGGSGSDDQTGDDPGSVDPGADPGGGDTGDDSGGGGGPGGDSGGGDTGGDTGDDSGGGPGGGGG